MPIDIALNDTEMLLLQNLPIGWGAKWITVPSDSEYGGTWCVIFSPDGIQRGKGRTALRAVMHTIDSLWITIAGALT